MPPPIDISFYYEVWKEINNLRWYFYKFAGVNADEAMERTLFHTLTHFNSEKGSLSAYVKKLAREITKDNSKLIFVDFLEQTLSDVNDDDSPEGQTKVIGGSVHDFSDEVADAMELAEDRRMEVVRLALEFMDKFMLLVDALQRRDTSTRYFPDVFIKSCMSISRRCLNFNQLCFDVFEEYGDDFKWFLELGQRSENWRESDFMMIRNSNSRRMKLVSPYTGLDIEDADVDKYVMQGKLGEGSARKKIIKVGYYDAWSLMCDLIDSEDTNEIKFIIGDSYVIRTFAGSLSGLNTDLFNMYNLVRSEILTNVLIDTGGRILNIGSENFYLLCNPTMNKQFLERDVHGYKLRFDYEDITDQVQ